MDGWMDRRIRSSVFFVYFRTLPHVFPRTLRRLVYHYFAVCFSSVFRTSALFPLIFFLSLLDP